MKRPLRIVPWVRPVVSDRGLSRQAYDSRFNEKGGILRPSRRVSPKREPGVWTWRPTGVERMEAFMDRHPILESLLGIALVGLMLGALIYLALVVPEATR